MTECVAVWGRRPVDLIEREAADTALVVRTGTESNATYFPLGCKVATEYFVSGSFGLLVS